MIVLTTYDGDEVHLSIAAGGAKGYLLKDVFFLRNWRRQFRTVSMAGARRIPAAIAEDWLSDMAGSELTASEMEVLELIVRGNSNKEIATRLNISEATVGVTSATSAQRLGVTDRRRPPPWPWQRGLVHLPLAIIHERNQRSLTVCRRRLKTLLRNRER